MPHPFKRSVSFLFFLINLFLSSAAKANPESPDADNINISLGLWRGEILRSDGHSIVFIFQTREVSGKIVIHVINGTERLLVDNIRQVGDSLFIDMPFFDSHFSLRIVDEKTLEGNWIKISGARKTVVPFRAIFNQANRFPNPKAPAFDVSGRWSAHFRGENDSTEAIGEFRQMGNQVSGTFLTSTGDYRFLEGVVDGDTLRLSTFDGGHAYSFVSRILDTARMQGFYYSGATSVETWVAEKDAGAKLPDEFSVTGLKDSSVARLHFTFPDLNGKPVSLSDPVFKNKVVIVQILGSWCPNCMDETRFLSPWYLQNKSRGVEIVGLAYERTTSFADAKRLLQPFITRFHVTYPILATGVVTGDSLRTEKTLPEIREIVGFPTTIFIDKKGMVRKIHTGFNGPGTGAHYDMFKKEFNEIVNALLAE
ncbi:MAG TPA: TlpA disulfide reductase family protein [Puia sp.]